MNQQGESSRRDFLKTGTAAAGAALATGLLSTGVYAAGSDEIKVGIIGCGDRGMGAADNVLHAAKGVTIVAACDAFEFQTKRAQKRLAGFAQSGRVKELGNKVDVTLTDFKTGTQLADSLFKYDGPDAGQILGGGRRN